MTRDITQQFSRFRIFILGAGFSRPADLPLASELWQSVLSRALAQNGFAKRFDADLAIYLRYRFECDGIELKPEEVDFEDFLAFLDIEHHLGLAGSDTWSQDGNESQVLVKGLIGQILVERTPPSDALPQLYYDFAEQLQPSDYVITFNYDTVLERSLDHLRRQYRLFPSRYSNIRNGIGFEDSSSKEVVILKLHGSVDWFDRTTYSELENSFGDFNLKESPRHTIFGPNASVGIKPLLEGPQFSDDPLRSVYRVVDGLENFYKSPPFFRATPFLLSPSKSKVLYADRFKYFWRGMGQAGGMNLGLIIIGYSLPSHDDYCKQALFRMVRNYQDSWWDVEWPGKLKKSPVLLIDRQDDDTRRKAFLSRFRFIEPHKAKFHFSGFNNQALALIRSED